MSRSARFFNCIVTTALAVVLCIGTAYSANLWKGEEVRQAAGYPAIIKFIKGDPEKPILVLIPGAHHMARIFYGDENRRREDFLSYWLGKYGYNILAISYPVDTPSKAFDEVYPDYSTQAWGRQAAEITKQIKTENNIKGDIIICGWSMAGKSAQPFNATAKKIGLDVDFYISLSATPPTLGICSMNNNIAMFPNGLANRTKSIAGWYKQIKKNSEYNDGRVIIPWEAYKADYTGAISIQQQAASLRYKKGEKEFVRDYWADLEDTKPYDFVNFPLVAVILTNNHMDKRHGLTDQAAWSLYVANKIYLDYCSKIDFNKLPAEQWRSLLDFTRNTPERLSIEVDGNHFFFVGESGARETAVAIKKLEERVQAVKAELSCILGKPIK